MTSAMTTENTPFDQGDYQAHVRQDILILGIGNIQPHGKHIQETICPALYCEYSLQELALQTSQSSKPVASTRSL
jgi:hypothetical protein